MPPSVALSEVRYWLNAVSIASWRPTVSPVPIAVRISVWRLAELSQMVVLQNSYSAAARVMSTASEMYDTLLAMVG